PDVVAGDADRIPPRELVGAVGDDVGDESHRLTRRVDVRAAGDVLLQDVVLGGPADPGEGHALALRDRDVHGEEDCRGRVDGYRGRDLIERDVLQQEREVVERRDRDADLADLAFGPR